MFYRYCYCYYYCYYFHLARIIAVIRQRLHSYPLGPILARAHAHNDTNEFLLPVFVSELGHNCCAMLLSLFN